MNDKYHGEGEEIDRDGDKYVGSFVNGEKHGEGVMTYADGTSKKGVWSEDKRIKWL